MPFKTLGPQSARLVTALYEENRPVFRVGDVQRVLNMKEDTARSFVRKPVDRAVASRLKPGLYILVPFELGYKLQPSYHPISVLGDVLPGTFSGGYYEIL